jgi:hypothetical protein
MLKTSHKVLDSRIDLYEQVVVIFISEHVPLPRNFLDRRMEKGIIPFMPWVILI